MNVMNTSLAATVDDAFVVKQVREGSEVAFHVLYKRHARYIAGVAYRILGNDADLDDVVQDTFVTAARKIDQLKEPEHIRLWLTTIAVRHTQKRLKLRGRVKLMGIGSGEEAARHVDSRTLKRLDDLREALSRMPEKLTTPWILHRVEGMTIKEAAAACGVSTATVKRRLSSAEAKLRRKIDVDG